MLLVTLVHAVLFLAIEKMLDTYDLSYLMDLLSPDVSFLSWKIIDQL